MIYGVYIEMRYESWMMDFATLREARAEVKKWRTRTKNTRPADISLVRIMSEHEEGDLL